MDVMYYVLLGVKGFFVTLGFLFCSVLALTVVVTVSAIVKGISGKFDDEGSN